LPKPREQLHQLAEWTQLHIMLLAAAGLTERRLQKYSKRHSGFTAQESL